MSLADEEEHGPNPKGVAGPERVIFQWRRRTGRGTRKRERERFRRESERVQERERDEGRRERKRGSENRRE